MTQITIRSYRPEDRAAVRQICFDTGFMGESIASQYADRESFADIFTAYYTDCEPQNVWIAESNGRVVGYHCAALDSRAAHGPTRYILKHALLRGVPFRPGCFRFYCRATLDPVFDLAKPRKPKIDLARFPSHNHINLLPEARGGGAAAELFFTLVDGLKRQGSPGMQAETLASNTVVAEFISRKLGGVKVGAPYALPGLRGKNGERIEAQAWTLDLTQYVPGAWKEKRPGTRANTERANSLQA